MTHLRLPKSAGCCWELNLAVPLCTATALALHGAGCGALPPAFHLSMALEL